MVATDHGGASRVHELSPFRTGDSEGQLDELLDWMERRLMLGGASMSGLAARWGHLTRPHVLGGALALSSSPWFGDRRLLELASQAQRPARTRVYVDAGARVAGVPVALREGTPSTAA